MYSLTFGIIFWSDFSITCRKERRIYRSSSYTMLSLLFSFMLCINFSFYKMYLF